MNTSHELEMKASDLLLSALFDEVENDLSFSYYQPPKAVDQAAARRLAKRLFYLEGFTVVDVSRHLVKRDEFSRLVGEEYLRHFQFTGVTLDKALREFLTKILLYGDEYDQIHILQYFSQRYHQCNPHAYPDADSCHYLTCALLVLSSGLHEQFPPKPITLHDFEHYIRAVEEHSATFSHEELCDLYESVKHESILCINNANQGHVLSSNTSSLSSSAFGLTNFESLWKMPEDREYLRGFLIRKCAVDLNGKKVKKPRRGWKVFYARLKGLYLYLYRTEDYHTFEKAFSQLSSSTLLPQEGAYSNSNSTNELHSINTSSSHLSSSETLYTLPEAEHCLPLYHSSAWIDPSYNKRPNTFRLRLHNGSEYYLRTYANVEMHHWLNNITSVAAVLSPTSAEEVIIPNFPLLYTDTLDLHQRFEQYAKQLSVLVAEESAIQEQQASKTLKLRQRKQFQQHQIQLQDEIERVKRYMDAISSILHQYDSALSSSQTYYSGYVVQSYPTYVSSTSPAYGAGPTNYSNCNAIIPTALPSSLQEKQAPLDLMEVDELRHVEHGL